LAAVAIFEQYCLLNCVFVPWIDHKRRIAPGDVTRVIHRHLGGGIGSVFGANYDVQNRPPSFESLSGISVLVGRESRWK
jgi:hypothetical protein